MAGSFKTMQIHHGGSNIGKTPCQLQHSVPNCKFQLFSTRYARLDLEIYTSKWQQN